MKYFISKSKTMFNLWSMTEKQETINGRDYNVQYYKKERVLAKTMEKATAKAPEGAEWCEWLIDYRWPTTRRKQLIDNHTPDKFFFGKYLGRRFDEVDDLDYLRWYHSKVEFEDQKETIAEILESHDYVLVDGVFVSPEKYDEKQFKARALRRARMQLDTMSPYGVECKHSLRSDGTLMTEDGVILEFQCKCQYYQGYAYGLPLDNKGVAKRIKDRKIMILCSELVQDDEFHPRYRVNSWEFF